MRNRPSQDASSQPRNGPDLDWRSQVTPQRVLFGVALLAAAGLLVFFREHLPIDEIRQTIERLDGAALFAAMTFLPMMAFPVTPLHVIAGVRFGWAVGLLLIALSIVLHHIIAWVAVRFAPDFFERRLARVRARIPRAAHAPVTVFTSLIPGVPYFATVYVLPLIGVPFPVFLGISSTLHAARSIVAVVFGDMSDNLTPGRLVYLVVYGIVITGTCAWLFRRLRHHLAPEDRDNAPRPDGSGFAAPSGGVAPGHSQSS